jgi:hypothetical protein
MVDVSELNPPKALLRMLGAEGGLLGGKGNPTGGRKEKLLSLAQVKHVQSLMTRPKGVGTSGLTYNVGEPDGDWGPKTSSAWRDLCSQASGANCQSYPNVDEVNEVLSLHGVT